MDFDRHVRVQALLLELIASFVRLEANANPLITITRTDISPDYKNVKVFFTTIPEKGQEDALVFLKRKGGDLRHYVKKHSNFKIIPFFTFEIDYGERNRQLIDTIVHKVEEE